MCRLREIEARLRPCGLHGGGSPPTAAEAVATLVNIAEIDRLDNDPPVYGLPGVLARTIGRSVEEIYLNNNKVPLASLGSMASLLSVRADRSRSPWAPPWSAKQQLCA